MDFEVAGYQPIMFGLFSKTGEKFGTHQSSISGICRTEESLWFSKERGLVGYSNWVCYSHVIVSVTKICLNETCNKVWVGNKLC